MVPTNHNKANKQKILNAVFYIMLAYQFVLLIYGRWQYKPLGHVHDGLYAFSFILIYLYILVSKTKEAFVNANCIRQKWFTGEIDKDEAEKAYYRQKRITLILVILFSCLAIAFAFISITQSFQILFKYILCLIGISALIIFVLTIVLGLIILIEFIQKPWKRHGNSLTFKLLLLQNFLISTAVLKMLANIQG